MHKNYKVNIESLSNTGPPVHSQVNILTDGSKTDEHVGSGYVMYYNNNEIAFESIRLSEEISVYQAEVLAIKMAADNLLQIKQDQFKFVEIYIDSQLMSLGQKFMIA